jgi:hypothetical protein
VDEYQGEAAAQASGTVADSLEHLLDPTTGPSDAVAAADSALDADAALYAEGDHWGNGTEFADGEALAYAEPAATAAADSAESAAEYALAGDQGEAITTPPPEFGGAFKPRANESDADRFLRPIDDVPLDIRPTEGAMPEDLAASKFEQQAQPDPRIDHAVEEVFCSYTPWTICFRPLYFEDVGVERYGQRVRVLQPAVSGAHFFANVALLPYKMRLRPPRSCVCSNGFSRVGDCPPPCYGDCYWRWDAAVVEAAAVTGFVFILP